MKKLLLLILLLPAFITVLALDYTPGQLLVKTVRPARLTRSGVGVDRLDQYLSSLQVKKVKPLNNKADNCWYVIDTVNEPDFNRLASITRGSSELEYIQPNYLNKFFSQPNDPMYPNQQLNLCNFPEAWELTTGSKQILVAIVDSGMAFDHPDLQTNIYHNPGETPDNGIDDDGNGYVDDWRGWDFSDAPELSDIGLGDYTEQDNDPSDENWHGTHIAGIVGADTNNSIGISGSCWNVNILVARAGFRTTATQGYLQDDDVSAAIIYATDMGADVINASWGDENYSQIIADACQYAYDHGTIIVAAAGNSPSIGVHYPARLQTCVSVGAVKSNLELAGFSSYGPELDIMAPGDNIISCYNPAGSVYEYQPGTSMAAPFVSGAVALFLSRHSGYSVDEVRQALFASARDLGNTGFDNRYGNGLLDVRAFLAYSKQVNVKITSPADLQAVQVQTDEFGNEYFDIYGSASFDDFFMYTVTYTDKEQPGITDWSDVYTSDKDPEYYLEPVVNGRLARFRIPLGFVDGAYRIRLRALDNRSQPYISDISVYMDRTAPVMREQYLSIQKRYNKENIRYYLQAVFNEPVNLQVHLTDASGHDYQLFSSKNDSLQVVALPQNMADGYASFNVTATNIAGLTYQSQQYQQFFRVQHGSVPVNTFTRTNLNLPPLVFVNKPADYNQNNLPEFWAMTFNNQATGVVNSWEFDGTTLTSVHQFADEFWPRASGETNGSGNELLATIADTAVLYESIPSTNPYPNIAVADSVGVVYGIFVDFDQDDTDEIIWVRNSGNTRVLGLVERTGVTTLAEAGQLINPTSAIDLNMFVPSLGYGNFDGDDTPDLLAADTDGDVMVYEFLPNGHTPLRWQTRLPVANAYQLGVGDFDGDGVDEFFVGGYVTNNNSPERTFWYFGFYRRTGDDANPYELYSDLMFDGYDSNNAVTVADVDNDGDDEVIAALTPHLYIFDQTNSTMSPVYYSTSNQNYCLSTLPGLDGNGFNLFFNDTDGSEDHVYMLSSNTSQLAAAAQNFSATPLNANEAIISWQQVQPQPTNYLLYRQPEGEPAISIQVDANLNSYTDTGLQVGKTYTYWLSYQNGAAISLPTLKKQVVTAEPPLISQQPYQVSTNSIALCFDLPLDLYAINPGNFYVDNGMGYPLSAIFTNQQQGILLKFAGEFAPVTDGVDYSLSISNIAGATGVAFNNGISVSYPVTLVADTTPPVLLGATAKDALTVELEFSEDMAPATCTNLANYSLVLPANDQKNSLVGANVNGNLVSLTFSGKLRVSNQAYHIYASGLTDLSGNILNNNGDNASFKLATINNLNYVEVVPNPLITTQYDRIRFINLPLGQRGSIRIYDLAGNLVFTDTITPLSEVENEYSWNAVNNVARKVSSGMYIYVIKMGDRQKRGKFAVVR